MIRPLLTFRTYCFNFISSSQRNHHFSSYYVPSLLAPVQSVYYLIEILGYYSQLLKHLDEIWIVRSTNL
jgi:hypothetical protein